MKAFSYWLAFLFCGLTFSACSTPTAYKAANGSGPGYTEQKLQDNLYRVTFTGNRATPRETVENYLLFRAAEITMKEGGDYFLVTRHSTEADTDFQVTSPAVYGNYSTHSRFPYYTYGFPWAQSTNVTTNKKYQATAYIRIKNGNMPSDNPEAFDARQIQQNLQNKIVRNP